ncbi:MAG: RNA-binding S4 domain-containing protein [Saprospiraceae bacterium]
MQREFYLKNSEYIALNNLLKAMHLVGTGGEANIRISNGEVLLNGEVETQKRKKIRPGDHVEFNEIRITVYRIINSSVF